MPALVASHGAHLAAHVLCRWNLGQKASRGRRDGFALPAARVPFPPPAPFLINGPPPPLQDDWTGAGFLAADLSRHASYGLSTSIVCEWKGVLAPQEATYNETNPPHAGCLIYSWFPNLAYGFTDGTSNSGAGHSLMTAAEPWSGYYQAGFGEGRGGMAALERLLPGNEGAAEAGMRAADAEPCNGAAIRSDHAHALTELRCPPPAPQVNAPLAAVAHWTQFADRGWTFLSLNASGGIGTLPGGGQYATIVNTRTPAGLLSFSLAAQTMQGAAATQTVTFVLGGLGSRTLPAALHVWQSTQGALMVQQPDVAVAVRPAEGAGGRLAQLRRTEPSAPPCPCPGRRELLADPPRVCDGLRDNDDGAGLGGTALRPHPALRALPLPLRRGLRWVRRRGLRAVLERHGRRVGRRAAAGGPGSGQAAPGCGRCRWRRRSRQGLLAGEACGRWERQ